MGVEAVDHDEQWLEVVYTDGTTGRFFGSWLRDNVMSGRHREGGQRTFDLNTLPKVKIASATRQLHGVAVTFAPRE